MSEVERLLRSALVPVEPPMRLSDRLERRLAELTEAAAGELADWELSAMRDPRNWARPLGAAVVVTLAGGALVLVRARQQQRRHQSRRLRSLEQGARDVAAQLRRRSGR
jgi:hypothetical protein